jgi:hypothetical protein
MAKVNIKFGKITPFGVFFSRERHKSLRTEEEHVCFEG